MTVRALPERPHYAYWGKAGPDGEHHLLVYHALDACAVAAALLEADPGLARLPSTASRLPPAAVKPLALFMVGLHDLGKFFNSFQNLRPDLLLRLAGLESNVPYHHRHDLLGLRLWMEDLLPGWPDHGWFGIRGPGADPCALMDCLTPWVMAVSGHHGRPPDETGNRPRLRDLATETDRAAARGFARDLYRLLAAEYPSLEDFGAEIPAADLRPSSWIVAGLCVLADWLASNSAFFPFLEEPWPLEKYWQRARDLAHRALRAAGLLPAPVSSQTGPAALFPEIETPSPLQELAARHPLAPGPKLFLVEESTGGGKTEAALVLAHRIMATGEAGGVFFALPTMATANAMYGRLAAAYQRLFADPGQASLVLAHGARRFHEGFHRGIAPPERFGRAYDREDPEAGAQCAAWLADNNKKSLLAAVGVGTVDQALLAVMPVRHQSLRLLGVARRVLIVDEVHAYDAYMRRVLGGLLEFQAALGGSAILLSATLPLDMRRELANRFLEGADAAAPESPPDPAFPLLTAVNGEDVCSTPVASRFARRTPVKVSLEEDSETILNALEGAARQGACACWIRNTVNDALEAWEMLSGRLDPERFLLFHARMALADRLDVEGEVLRRFGKESRPDQRAGSILIATQVVEQSLDLDFDFLVSDLAPMDLLIQRLGRLHRHDRPGRPIPEPACLVHGPKPIPDAPTDWYQAFFPRGAFVYPHHGRLWLTARLLEKHPALTFPDQSRELIEGVYGPNAQDLIPTAIGEKKDLRAEGQDAADKSLASLNTLEVRQGYGGGFPAWREDTPTRLGRETTVLRLARWDGERLRPWAKGDGAAAWHLSEVRVRRGQVHEEAPAADARLAGELDRVKSLMPDAEYCRIIPLTADGADWHHGEARNNRGQPVTLRYHPRRGVIME